MEPRPQLSFEPFRLDPDNACLWRESEAVPLKPKAFAVLQCLVEHAGRLVTKEVLLQSVWPDSAVSDAVLKVCISEIRKAMDDTAEASRFIVTVHRRGYRFVAPVATARSSVGRPPRSMPPAPPVPMVGREVVLGRLHGSLAAALRGERQVVFVTGEAGIGKTATVDAFLAQAADDPALGIVRGQCVELYGSAEPYLPVLDALGRLCREPEGEPLTALLRQHAPSWLVQMPGLVRLTDRDALPPECLGATRDRMLREMVDLVDVLTGETPLVLVLEDLHWSDGATVDLVSALARRREPARLLVIGTFRPADLIVEGHPLRGLKQELSQRGYCDEIPLEPLSQARVVEYLSAPGFPAPRYQPNWRRSSTNVPTAIHCS
jgi:DNA-binding winged helix-turn-helix (wHTH) protein